MPGVRSALMTLSPDGREELEIRLGKPAVERMMRSVRSVSRGFRGRVVVIHGIMGGKLATRDASGDEDLVWLFYPRLFTGRIEDFELDENGNNAKPGIDVLSCGLLDEYLPLVTELDGTWQVLPFAFDWRLDIGRSAAKLDDAIREWAGKEPVHIVAHSMGGLVARRFIQDHADTWKAMADPDGLRSGGRLVMLGTPNRGSFAIPFVLTGEEKTVKMLEKFDVKHNMNQLLAIIDTFVGSYQMMPSPKLSFGDDRAKLYKAATWGSNPVTQKLLDAGRAFQEKLDEVIDPDRLVYVAGYDQPTPYRIQVEGPGQFRYQQTQDGDGRVPHELGRLPGVATFYIKESHGDLPSNERVLAGIHELLQSGTTSALETSVPQARAAPSREWLDAGTISPMPPEVTALIGAGAGARGGAPVLRGTQTILESALVESFVGARGSRAEFQPSGAQPREAPRTSAKGRPVEIEVMWGDICQADGDIYAAGHYQGVSPQFGELSLDRMVSGIPIGEEPGNRKLVITTLTRRGMIRASVGDVEFFPWAGAGRKTVAIAGMGYPGTFARNELQRLARSLTQAVAVLPGVKTVNTLLIGSGAGNLNVATALDAMLAGMIEALGDGGTSESIRKVRIVERDWRQAQAIFRILEKLVQARSQSAALAIGRGVVVGKGGRYSDEILLSVVAAAASRRSRSGAAGKRALAQLLAQVPSEARGLVRDAVEGIDEKSDVLKTADALNLRYVPPEDARMGPKPNPTRISFLYDDNGAHAAAIADTAVVPERFVAFNWKLVDELIVKMTDPSDVATIRDNAGLMADFIVPRDFRADIVDSSTMIFEVDRKTARVHWEMLGNFSAEESSDKPLALERGVARQLRTTYSPPPSRAAPPSDRLRALVVGDPGDPDAGLSLPGARREAIEVAKLLQAREVEVTALIGAPSAPRTGELAVFAPASMLDVLAQLRKGFDILHYAGHGDFRPEDPESAGWIFGRELFTARELGTIDKVPRMTVANACLSGLLSDKTAAPSPSRLQARDAYLLPGLADEFFKRGVRNYIGTAWPVNDDGAILFAQTLYETLLDPATRGCLGDALLAARKKLKEKEAVFGALWAAYQHYGDPMFQLRP
ncbi:MAG: CHAT domain-containing protein [Usitatibacter sp.]